MSLNHILASSPQENLVDQKALSYETSTYGATASVKLYSNVVSGVSSTSVDADVIVECQHDGELGITSTNPTSSAKLAIYDETNIQKVVITVPNNISNYSLTLPASGPTSTSVLSVDATGQIDYSPIGSSVVASTKVNIAGIVPTPVASSFNIQSVTRTNVGTYDIVYTTAISADAIIQVTSQDTTSQKILGYVTATSTTGCTLEFAELGPSTVNDPVAFFFIVFN